MPPDIWAMVDRILGPSRRTDYDENRQQNRDDTPRPQREFDWHPNLLPPDEFAPLPAEPFDSEATVDYYPTDFFDRNGFVQLPENDYPAYGNPDHPYWQTAPQGDADLGFPRPEQPDGLALPGGRAPIPRASVAAQQDLPEQGGWDDTLFMKRFLNQGLPQSGDFAQEAWNRLQAQTRPNYPTQARQPQTEAPAQQERPSRKQPGEWDWAKFWKKGGQYSNNGEPMNYGDRESLEAAIRQQPLNADPHLMLADWHREQGDEQEGAFREGVGRSVQRRLANPWQVPKTRGGGWGYLEHPNPHGPIDQFVNWSERPNGTISASEPSGHPIEGEWEWRVPIARDFQSAPDFEIPRLGDWIHSRLEGTYPGTGPGAFRDTYGVSNLSPAERTYAGIDNLEEVDPSLWPLIEQIMRQQHGRGLRFSDTEEPMNYDDEAGFRGALRKDPGELTARGAYSDWLEEQGRATDAGFQRALVDSFGRRFDTPAAQPGEGDWLDPTALFGDTWEDSPQLRAWRQVQTPAGTQSQGQVLLPRFGVGPPSPHGQSRWGWDVLGGEFPPYVEDEEGVQVPDPAWWDQFMGAAPNMWGDERDRDVALREANIGRGPTGWNLTRPQRAFTGVDQLTPELLRQLSQQGHWPALEQMFRNRFDRGMRFEDEGEPTAYGFDDDLAGMTQGVHQDPLDVTGHLALSDFLADNDRPADAKFRQDLGNLIQTRTSTPWKDKRNAVSGQGFPFEPTVRGFSSGNIPRINVVDPALRAIREMRPSLRESLGSDPERWRWGTWGTSPASSRPDGMNTLSEWLSSRPAVEYPSTGGGTYVDHGTLNPAELGAYDFTDLANMDPQMWPQVEALLRQNWDRFQQFADDDEPMHYAGESAPTPYFWGTVARAAVPVAKQVGKALAPSAISWGVGKGKDYLGSKFGDDSRTAQWGGQAADWGASQAGDYLSDYDCGEDGSPVEYGPSDPMSKNVRGKFHKKFFNQGGVWSMVPSFAPDKQSALWTLAEGQPDRPMFADGPGGQDELIRQGFWYPDYMGGFDPERSNDEQFRSILTEVPLNELYHSGHFGPVPGAGAPLNDWQSRLVFADWLQENHPEDEYPAQSHSTFGGRYFEGWPLHEVEKDIADRVRRGIESGRNEGLYADDEDPAMYADFPVRMVQDEPITARPTTKRRKKSYFFADDEDPTAYEDFGEDFLRKNPFDTTGLAVSADWYDDQNNPEEAAFRRDADEYLRGRLSQGWNGPPEVTEGGLIADPDYPFTVPVQEFDGWIDFLRPRMASEQTRASMPNWWWGSDFGLDPSRQVGSEGFPGNIGFVGKSSDEAVSAAKRNRLRMGNSPDLTQVEQAFGGITDISKLTPDQYVELINLMRQRRQELGHFADDEDPTNYGDVEDLRGAMGQNPWESDLHLRLADAEAEAGNEQEALFREQVGRWLPGRVGKSTPPTVHGTASWLFGPYEDQPFQMRTWDVDYPNHGRTLQPRYTGGFGAPTWGLLSTEGLPHAAQAEQFFGLPRGRADSGGMIRRELPGSDFDEHVQRPLEDGERAYLGLDDINPDTDPNIWPQIEAILRDRHRLGQRFADDDEPMQYGDAEDEAAFVNEIHQNPLELTGHDALADWYADRGRAGDESFRRNLSQGIGRRLSTPWKAPQTDSAGWMLPGTPHGVARDQEGGRPDLPVMRTASSTDGSGQRNISRWFPALSNGDWDLNDYPEGTWHWGIGSQSRYYPEDDLRAYLQLGPDEDLNDWIYPTWRNGEPEVLRPEERLWAGIDDWANLDPKIWPQLEALLRRQHGRGERLASDDEPTPYAGYYEPGNGGDYIDEMLAIQDALDAAAASAWHQGAPDDDYLPGGELPVQLSRYASVPRDQHGRVQGIMQGMSESGFRNGQWGPKLAPSPMNYDDREALEAQIAQEPRNVDPHLMLADWHREQGNEAEGDFREGVGRSIQRRLASPWKEPQTQGDWGPLIQPNAHGPVDPYFQSFLVGNNEEPWISVPGGHPIYGEWEWRGSYPEFAVPEKGPIPGLADALQRRRNMGLPVDGLHAAERAYAGIDDLTTIDPELWPLVEQIMRQQHGRGMRFEGGEAPTEYNGPGCGFIMDDEPVMYPPNARTERPTKYLTGSFR